MFKGQKIDGGKVHIFNDSSSRYAATFCTGRAIDMICTVSEATRVDCAACVKRAAKMGVEV